ncbi:MAG: alpha/beta hydrolase [Pseudomonadota bacterium]
MARSAIRLSEIEGAPGISLALREAGSEDAPPIILLHGWSQSSLSWRQQLEGTLAQRFHLLAPDLRGHGASSKPEDPAAYASGGGWAADIAALVARCAPARPVIVGWSMGGMVLADYLRIHGDAALAGIVTVGTVPRMGAKGDPVLMARRKPDVRAEGMYHADHLVQLDTAIAFARAMTTSPLSKRDLAFHVGLMMSCPPAVRRAARLRDEDWRDAWAAVRCPALVLQGGAERVCFLPQAEELAATIPGAALEVMPGCGHMPFWEQPAAFDARLEIFADHALATS